MPRAYKDARILTINMATPIYDHLGKFCEENRMSKTAASENIFTRFMNEYFEVFESKRTIISML